MTRKIRMRDILTIVFSPIIVITLLLYAFFSLLLSKYDPLEEEM